MTNAAKPGSLSEQLMIASTLLCAGASGFQRHTPHEKDPSLEFFTKKIDELIHGASVESVVYQGKRGENESTAKPTFFVAHPELPSPRFGGSPLSYAPV